jgi:hypothetical protein
MPPQQLERAKALAADRQQQQQQQLLLHPHQQQQQLLLQQQNQPGLGGWLGSVLSAATHMAPTAQQQAQSMQHEADRLAATRMHLVFKIPFPSAGAGASSPAPALVPASAALAAAHDPLGAPAQATALGTPAWLQRALGWRRIRYPRLTALGRAQLASGARASGALAATPPAYVGDPLVNPPPICAYEVALLVRLALALSLAINKALGLDEGAKRDPLRVTFRVDLRFLADARNLLFAAVLAALLNAALLGAPGVTAPLAAAACTLALFLAAGDVAWPALGAPLAIAIALLKS